MSMLVWLLRLAWRRVRGVHGPAISTLSIRGLFFTLDWAASEHVPLREILGQRQYWPTARFRPSPGQVVVDVGANAGVFATVAASWIGPTGRLVAIEPNPEVARRLELNLRQNGFAERSVVIEEGLSDHAGQATLYIGTNSTTATLSPAAAASTPGIKVRVGSMDAVAADMQLATVDLLKVDVEGLEATVLDGAATVLVDCRRAVIEVSDAGDVDAVIERCRAAGLGRVTQRTAGIDSGATLVYAERG